VLTLFTIPRAFEGEAGERQRVALESWARLPGAEIVLFGDDPGVAEAAAEFGALHVPQVGHTELGTPLVSSAFATAHEVASNRLLCYVNADIVLLGDVLGPLAHVGLPRFLVTGRCFEVDPEAVPADGPTARRAGRMTHAFGSDWFVFPADGTFARMPPFAVGRPAWDNWMVFHARREGVPVVDGTAAITAVHPRHGHEHVPARNGIGLWGGPEADANVALRRGDQPDPSVIFHLWDATHVLTPRGLRSTRRPVALWRRYRTRRALGGKAVEHVA